MIGNRLPILIRFASDQAEVKNKNPRSAVSCVAGVLANPTVSGR